MNRAFSLIGILSALTPTSSLYAQTPDHPLHDSPQEHEIDTAHDKLANDPSRGPRYHLISPINQKSLILWGVDHRINSNIDDSFEDALFNYDYLTPKSIIRNPEYTKFFKIHSNRYNPQLEHGPTTVNADHEYTGISDRKYGYCWGYATLVRYFSVLAFFDETLPRRGDIEFYKNKVDQILRGEATIIPGYANLREFSLNPKIEFYLKINAMELWRSRAVRASSLGIFGNATESMNFNEVENLLKTLEIKLARGELPKILFSSLIPAETVLGMNTDIHVVLAHKVERLPNHRARIHLWDINFYTETLMQEPKYLEITSPHGIRYEPWFEPTKTYAEASALIARVNIAPEDNAENAQMLTSLKAFCENRTTMKYCTPHSKH